MPRARFGGLQGLAALTLLAGCGPSLEQSPAAQALPAVAHDAPLHESAAQHWPGFRGPGGSGVAIGAHFSTQGTLEQRVQWQTPLPGSGNSSPVVWGDAVFLTAALPGDPPPLAVLAVNRSDGRIRWQTVCGSARGPSHLKNGHATPTVAVDGSRLVAYFGSAGLYCFNHEGQLQWQADLGEREHKWGAASSPVLAGETVIQLADAATDSALVAFDLMSGKPRWRVARSGEGSFTTPILISAPLDAGGARQELIVSGTGDDDGWIIAYDPENGEEFWRARGTTSIPCPSPLFAGGLVYAMSGRNGPIVCVRPGGTGDVTASRVVWKQSKGGPYIPTGVVYRNRLYTVNDGGLLTCYNAGSGEEIWKSRLGGNHTAGLVAGDGKLFAVSEQGSFCALAAGEAFELLVRHELDGGCLATPALAGNELFIRTEKSLYKLGAAGGAVAK